MSDEKQKITDEMIVAKWRLLLRTFDKIIQGNPAPEKVKDELIGLKEMAKNTYLTPKQVDGIHGRCDNYLNGQYGNTKTDQNFGHGKVIPATNGKQS